MRSNSVTPKQQSRKVQSQMESNLDDQVIMDDILFATEEAIPLIIFNEEKRCFEINEEGKQFLHNLKGPLGIVAVAGMYRTGKSYLLNRMLLDRSDGFGVGPTINPCTKGVWMWSRPLQGQTPDGDPIQVIIMDTEGLGALDEDSNHDVRIFSLAILLSSYFIYNSVGSIDENALQNLNLVVNLTKHIQVKSSGIQEEIDPQEFAKYFPSFMWVVRDFSLQLVDSEGDPINAKEYLEKALQSQKGFSESVDQKNRIRRLLKSFFADRDCVTMIRPLTSEDALQNLINIPMDKLRPEFVEQVNSLRRKVLHRVKPKTINGKNLNGDMFWNLCKSYVDAINKGAIPSIENSWAYICKNECLKALDDAFDRFQKNMIDEISHNDGPLYDDELKEKYSNAKKYAIEFFQKVAVGEVKDKFLEQLKDKMKQKYLHIKQDNEQSCEQECILFLRSGYTEIERALKNQDYGRFIDYLQDLMQFKQMFEESGPPGTNRKEILLDFCFKAVMEASEFFLGNTLNDLNLHRALAEETIKKLSQQLDELKHEQKEKIDLLESKLRKSDIEKAEVSAKEQSTREHLQQVQKEKQQAEMELSQRLFGQKKEFERQFEETQQKMMLFDEQRKEIQRQQIATESEFDKQKALFEQKIEFLEKALNEASQREKETSSELKNCKKDFLTQSKEHTAQLEKQIKDQAKLIEELKELNYEQETRISDVEILLEEQKNKLTDEITQKSKELRKSRESENDLSKKYETLLKKYETDCQDLKGQSENTNKQNIEKIGELEGLLKEKEETFDMAKQKWAKDKAVLEQKLEFSQFQLDEEKRKLEEHRTAHESMLKSLQSSSRESVIGREEAMNQQYEMEQKYIEERKKLEWQHNETRNRLLNELEILKKKYNEVELQLKLKDTDYFKSVTQLKEQLTEAIQTRDQALLKQKNLDSMSNQTLQKAEEEFRLREQELERQLDEKEQEVEDLIREHNEKSEQQLNDLKRFYEEERERIERRSLDERARFERKMNATTEEYEDKIQEIRNNHEDAINNLLEEKNMLESQLRDLQNQLNGDIQALQERIDHKDRQLAELKENYANLQNTANRQNDIQGEKFAKERKELNERLEFLSSEISKRDRTILSLENQKDGLSSQIQYKEKLLEELRVESQAEKNSMVEKIEDLKIKYEKAMDELTQSRINFERDKALKDQKILFQDQRINEYNDQMKQSIERYEERLKQEKDEFQKTLSERIARIQQEKDSVEKKYEQKRKAMKDLEKNIQLASSQHEREQAVQREKFDNLERSQKELIKNLELENAKLQEQNEELNEALSKGEIGIREEMEEWKIKFYETDRAFSDLQTEFEKEKALWQGKFEFLEKQKEQYKKDNEDAHQLFQQTVDQLQRDQKDTKSKHEQTHNAMIAQLEQKYKKEIRDIVDQNQAQIEKLQHQINKLEKEKKTLHEKLEISEKSMMSEHGGLEKKVERLLEEKERYTMELETLKIEKDKKIDELKRQFEREKEILKQKNNELLQKSKAIESKQTELILSHETNRAKWDQEKSFILSAKEDAVAEQKAIQRKYENLMKEIERLKEQNKRNSWKKIGQTGNIVLNNAQLYKAGNDVLGRLNLGGAGQGLNNRSGVGNELLQSTNNMNLNKGGDMAGVGSFRQNFGVDKSMDNLKLGFSQQFGSQLGLGKFSQNKGLNLQNSSTQGAVAQPQPMMGQLNLGSAVDQGAINSNRQQLDTSLRGSNILSTPSDKGDQQEYEEDLTSEKY